MRKDTRPIMLKAGVPLSTSTALAVPNAMSSTETTSGHCNCSSPARTHSSSVSAGVNALRIYSQAEQCKGVEGVEGGVV